MENKYMDGTVVQQGDTVRYSRSGHVVLNAAYSGGFVSLIQFDSHLLFTQVARIEECTKYAADADEKKRAIEALNKVTSLSGPRTQHQIKCPHCQTRMTVQVAHSPGGSSVPLEMLICPNPQCKREFDMVFPGHVINVAFEE